MKKSLIAAVAVALAAGGLIAPAAANPPAPPEPLATITGYAPGAEGSNFVSFWCGDGEGERIDSGEQDITYRLLPDPPTGSQYTLAVVKAGGGERENTIFGSPSAGEHVWADTDGNGQWNPGSGDLFITQVIYCWDDQVEPEPCPPGSYSPTGNAPCAEAPPGTFVNTTGATQATPCPVGTYQNLAGQLSCFFAPPGTFVDSAGATQATPCQVGTYQNLAGQLSCFFAPPGTFVDSAGATQATPCQVGTYQDLAGQLSCFFAPPGTFVDSAGATQATPCQVGTYQDLAGQLSCFFAPAGTFVDSAGATQATPCQVGTYQNLAGQLSCFFALPGTFVDSTGATQTTPAPLGTYVATIGAAFPTDCPSGTTTRSVGSDSADDCVPVLPVWTLSGFYQPVDMGDVWNNVKSGSTVPLKFEVFAGATELTDVAVVDSFVIKGVTCAAGIVVDDIEFTTTGGTTLRYDSTGGQFIQNWRTPKGKAGYCYEATLTTDDGSSISASFKLK